MPLRNFMVAAGIFTLIQAAVQVVFAAFAIMQYFCFIDLLRRYPLFIFIKVLYFINPSTCNNQVNIGQSLDGIGDTAFILITRQAPSVFRTVVISSISSTLGLVWVIGSIWMIRGGARPQASAHTHWPWTTATSLNIALDLVAIVTSYNDKNYTQTLDDLVKYIGATVSGLGGAQVSTSLAAKAMTLLYTRFGVILINILLLIYGCYDAYVPHTMAAATAEGSISPNSFLYSALIVKIVHTILWSSLSQLFPNAAYSLSKWQDSRQVEIPEKDSDVSPASSMEETKIPRPGLSRSFRTMKNFLFSKSGSGRGSLDGGRNRQRVNFSSGPSAESILAEKQRVNLALIQLAGRRSPEQRSRRLASSFAQPNESAATGRLGTTVELQAQKPWSYMPAAHRMRDQLPPDEDLPPVPLPDYTAFQSGRKASVHRAASSLSSITQRKDYASYQSRQPPPPPRREHKQTSTEALVAAASPPDTPRLTHDVFPEDSDDEVPTSAYDLVTQQNTLYNSSSNICSPRIPYLTHTTKPVVSDTDTTNPVQKTIPLVPHNTTCRFEMPRYVRKLNDGSQLGFCSPITFHNYAANMSTTTYDITPEISVTDTTKSIHEAKILVPQNICRRFVKPPNVSMSNISPMNTAALNIRYTNTSQRYVRKPIVSRPTDKLPIFNPVDNGAQNITHFVSPMNRRTVNISEQRSSTPDSGAPPNVSHGDVCPINIKTGISEQQGNPPNMGGLPHVRCMGFSPINARTLNISAPNISIPHSATDASVNDDFEVRHGDVTKQTISGQSNSNCRDVGPLNVRTWRDNPLYSTPAEVRALLTPCPVHKVSGQMDSGTNNFGAPKLNPLYYYSSENVMATSKTCPVHDFPSRNSETRTCQRKVTIPLSASMPNLHLLSANALDDGQKVDNGTNVFALNVTEANVKPNVFNPLNGGDLDSIRTYRDPQDVGAPAARFTSENVWNIIPLLTTKNAITYSLLAVVYFGGSYSFYWFYIRQ